LLARLDQINGVESSFANGSGTLIRLSLRPGANPESIAREVRRVLTEQVEDRTPVQLGPKAIATALQQEEWRDKTQVAELARTERETSAYLGPAIWGAVLLSCTALGLGFVWWRYCRRLLREET
jgi:hypothetical protein